MKITNFLVLIALIAGFTSCKDEKDLKKGAKEFVVIRRQDSILKEMQKTNQMPIIPQEMKWYSDLVFIMDSKDKVYVYQTEVVALSEIADFKYPNYIGLRPEYLTTINSNDFVSFLKNNNDIFAILRNKQGISNFFYIASESDTIKNQALYDLEDALGKERGRSSYFVRKTTEEENVVLKFKRNQHDFIPENIKWSMKFYNGQVSPYTPEYETFKKKINSEVKAKETFMKKIEFIDM